MLHLTCQQSQELSIIQNYEVHIWEHMQEYITLFKC
jgi:hypothetical protein